ncbi:MAG: MurR/RpiR family transcriptional regulator [Lachnospiraceae bacterium]|nr:MurR/RpiR family transcriptional regulator [Lachnospiraceae bacterium]
MVETNNLSARMNAKYSKMSKGQKKLTAYISENYDEAAFLTASRMGEIVGVSESTVVRFASFLGYKGYPQFMEAMGDIVKGRLAQSEKPETITRRASDDKLFSTFFKNDIQNLKETMRYIGDENFNNAVEVLCKANRIYVIGLGDNGLLAEYFSKLMLKITSEVKLIKHSDISGLFGQLLDINEGDAVVAVSMKPYSMKTLKALEYANDRHAMIVTITDTLLSPVNLYSSCNLAVSSDMSDIMGSITSGCALIQALFLSVQRRNSARFNRRTEELEGVLEEYQLVDDEALGFAE